MAKKKRARKVKRAVSRAASIRKPAQASGSYQKSFKAVLSNLIIYVLLSAISFILYKLVSNQIYQDLFWILSIILGCIALALLIAFLVIVLLRAMKK